MALCKFCGKITVGAATCIKSDITINGKTYAPIPHSPPPETVFQKERPQGRCPECNVKPGGFHHVGCGFEVCPKCGYKWIYCRCAGKKVPVGAASGRVIPFKRKRAKVKK